MSTYVPWDWHEYEEGKFDFEGKTVPERDLIGFIKLAKKMNLYVTIKPGPYIIAEYINQGLPLWLSKNYPDHLALTPQGINVFPFIVSYMHPDFLACIRRWYDKVLAIVRDYQVENNGPIAMLQVCNEVGLNQWLGGLGDYSPVTLQYYHQYLKDKYKDIAEMNSIMSTHYKTFDEVEAPSGIACTKHHFNLHRQWHLFHRHYYALYLDWIIDEVRSHDVNVLLYHNVPGWVYSRAKDFPLNITMYDEVFKKHKDVVFGVDHIPENPSYRNMHDDFPCNEILKAMRFREGPIFAAEFQAGSREYCVRTYPKELELFYKSSLGNGLFGMNFYMFSQGKNPQGKGHYGPTFYWDTALDVEGKELPLYSVIKDMGYWLGYNGQFLLRSERKSNMAVGFYAPYYETEFTHPFGGAFLFDPYGIGLKYDTKPVRDQIYFDGLLKAVQMLNYDIDIYDLEKTTVEELLEYKQLSVVSLEYMSPETQRKIVDYVRRGGNLILMPTVPHFDLFLNKCTILKDALKLKEIASITPASPKIDFMGMTDQYVFSRINEYESNAGKVIARVSDDGKPCGFNIKCGKGKVLFLGTGFTNCIHEHRLAYEKILSFGHIKKNAYADNEDIRVVQRFGTDYAYLFIINYHNMAHTTKVFYTDPITGKELCLPKKGRMTIPPMTAYMLPVCLPLPKEKGRIVSSTVEVYNSKVKKAQLIIDVKGIPSEQGELDLELQSKPKSVLYNNKKILFSGAGKKISLKFINREGFSKISINF